MQTITTNQLEKSKENVAAISDRYQQALTANSNQPLSGLQMEHLMFTDEGIGEYVYNAGLNYFAQLDIMNKGFGNKNNIAVSRDVAVGVTGFMLYTVSFFTIVMFQGGSLFMDINGNAVNTHSMTGNSEDEVKHNLAAGMYSSAMESEIWEMYVGCASVSTMVMLQTAADRNVPVYVITPENYNSLKNKISVSSELNTEIQTEIQKGNYIICHNGSLKVNNWNGYGYMVLNPQTGKSSYMISGNLSGGHGSFLIDLAALFNIIVGIMDIVGSCRIMAYAVGLAIGGSMMGPLLMEGGFIAGCLGVNWLIDSFTKAYQYYAEGDESAGEEILTDVTITAVTTIMTVGIGVAADHFINSKVVKELIDLGVSDELAEQFARSLSSADKNLLKKLLKNGANAEYIEYLIKNVDRKILRYSDKFFAELSKLPKSSLGDVAESLLRYGDDAANVIAKYSDNALSAMKNGIEPNLIKNLDDLGIRPTNFNSCNIITKEAAEKAVSQIVKRGKGAVDFINSYGQIAMNAFDHTDTLLTGYSKLDNITAFTGETYDLLHDINPNRRVLNENNYA